METTKKCTKCNILKPTSSFCKKSSSLDGLQCWCRSCAYITSREWIKNNPDKVKKQQKRSCKKLQEKYANNDEYREAMKIRTKKFKNSLSVEEKQKRNRSSWLKTTYGLTVEQYEIFLKEQNGCCAICKCKSKKLDVDHDHATGEVRGLLCQSCNRSIGLLGDTAENVMRAVDYLSQKTNQAARFS